jgi:hypothetical protein
MLAYMLMIVFYTIIHINCHLNGLLCLTQPDLILFGACYKFRVVFLMSLSM